MRRRWPWAVGLAVLAGSAAGPALAQQPAITIPGPLDGPLPLYAGAPTTARPLPGPYPPANPALAGDGRSGTGLAAGNGAASPFAGPLGHETRSESTLAFSCASLAFDSKERLLALCNGPFGPALRLIDPDSLDTLSSLNLPAKAPPPDRTDLGGGTHFLVRDDGTIVLPTNTGTLMLVRVDGNALKQTGSVALGGLLARGERPFAVAAGYDGYDWVVGNLGTVIAVPRDGGGTPRKVSLGEPVYEDLATHPTGTYVVTRDALHRLRAGADGTPRRIWRQPLLSGLADPRAGRLHPGPGTPPAIVAGGYVAVADALNPPRINVVRIAGRDSRRLRCAVPVFKTGPGSIEAHLVVAGRSIVAANAYGYENLMTTEGGRTSVGGITRVVVGKRGCRTAWTSKEISVSAQAVVSRATGLLYTLVKPAGFPDAWNLAALDWRTGKTRFAALAGEGMGHNSEGGALALAPDGTAFAGTFGGVVRFRDTVR